jgi:glutamyl-tRNA reductase
VERLALIGVSHKRGGAAAIELWRRSFGEALPEGLAGVVLATCNRWDAITALPEGCDVAALRRRLTPPGAEVRPYAFVGEGALEQLCRIAASLDSLNPGEDQIMRQVREALACAQRRQQVGPVTHFAFHTALRVAKRVRREVALAPIDTSLFSLARPELERLLPAGGRVAVVGAGEMGALAAKSLAALPSFEVIVVNRTLARAEHLARQLKVRAAPLGALLGGGLGELQTLVCATPVEHLITPEVAQRYPELCCLIDLGLPRNVHPELARRLPTLDVDTLKQAGSVRRRALQDKLAEAERIVQAELEQALSEWTERQLGSAIRKLRARYLATIGDSLPSEAAAQLAHRFAHIPVKGLRALARECGLETAQVFLAAIEEEA